MSKDLQATFLCLAVVLMVTNVLAECSLQMVVQMVFREGKREAPAVNHAAQRRGILYLVQTSQASVAAHHRPRYVHRQAPQVST